VKVLWTANAWEDYVFWQGRDDKIVAEINRLIEDIRRRPFQGLGKPEPLKHRLSGWWSRRITQEHRLVYRVSGAGESQQVEIAMCRYHY
jgi:toxin YoeB